MFWTLGPWLLIAAISPQPLPEVRVTADDTRIDRSCRVVIEAGAVIPDVNDNGVIHIVADDITVDFRGATLRGSPETTAADQRRGIGVRVDGQRNVRLTNLDVRGFRVGLRAENADGLAIDKGSFRDNFAQRLASTPEAEQTIDWLSPHYNDNDEWCRRYGAAVSIVRSNEVTVRRVVVRRGQNGIVLDRVQQAKIYDNDASFLSGWGLALWRSSDNVISRNAFDFCIRGYSHGVYNRGQDSAGILMFEQCSRNTIVENSVTHGGDGLFAFAGREALGESKPPEGFDHRAAGNNDNIIVRNDFSYAAAHGVELTFSFRNRIVDNRIVGNAICGMWGGYSQETQILGNWFEKNGDAGYGLERGGINIEHGRANVIHDNRFIENACGVHLWWDADEGLAKTPWAKANDTRCIDNRISHNLFSGDEVALHLRASKKTVFADNRLVDVGMAWIADPPEPDERSGTDTGWVMPTYEVFGRTRPVGRRKQLAGRANIIMTEWGPWDHEAPLVRRVPGTDDASAVYEVFRVDTFSRELQTECKAMSIVVTPRPMPHLPTRVEVRTDEPGVHRYRIILRGPEGSGFAHEASGTLVVAPWTVCVFPWKTDPREDRTAWLAEAKSGVTAVRGSLDLPYAMGGPRDIAWSDEIRTSGPGPDRFGTIATTELPLAKGRYRIITDSDDGIRVTADGVPVVEDWTWHGPTRREGTLVIDEPRTVALRVEHFELDGYALLRVRIEPVIEPAPKEPAAAEPKPVPPKRGR